MKAKSMVAAGWARPSARLLSVGDAEKFAAASRKVTSPSRWTDRGIVSLAAFATALEKVTATLKKISRYGASALV